LDYVFIGSQNGHPMTSAFFGFSSIRCGTNPVVPQMPARDWGARLEQPEQL